MNPESLWVLRDEMQGSDALRHLLRLDNWKWDSALWILMGLDEKTIRTTTEIELGETKEVLEAIETLCGKLIAPWDAEIDKVDSLFSLLAEIWNSGVHPEFNPPTYYIDWAMRKGFSIPWLEWAQQQGLVDSGKAPRLAKAIPVQDPASISNRSHVSDKLARLNQAAQKFWANASQSDRSTHPENATVAAWLINQGFSESLAERAASIIRPEWAPSGRKPEE